MKKKLLIIGDSLALPGHSNKYEDTWPFMLKNVYENTYDFIPFLRRALTSDILNTLGGGDDIDKLPRGADLLEHYLPNTIIIQLGIVDCAPRLFNRNKISTKIINNLPLTLKNNIYKLKEKYSKRRVENVGVYS